MADSYSSGLTFGDFLKNNIAPVARVAGTALSGSPVPLVQQVVAPAADAAASRGAEFVRGLFGMAQPSVTVALPPARPVDPAAVAAAQPKPAAAAKAPASQAAAAQGLDPATLKALGGLSFRQLTALSQVADNTSPKGVAARPPGAPDMAGQLLIANTYPTYQSMMAAAKSDTDKQAITDKYNKDVLMPLALRGQVGQTDLSQYMNPPGN